MSIKGKILMVVTRINNEGEDDDFEFMHYTQKCAGGWEAMESLDIELEMLSPGDLPPCVHRLWPGETVRFAASVEVVHYRSFDFDGLGGDFGADVYFNKVRVRRVQKYRPRYIPKAER